MSDAKSILDIFDFGTVVDHACLSCPACGFPFTHIGDVREFDGDDDYKASHIFDVRGNVVSIDFSSECGCEWKLLLGFHKGNTFIKTEVIKPCAELPTEPIFCKHAPSVSLSLPTYAGELSKCESPIEKKFFLAWKSFASSQPASNWAIHAHAGPQKFIETPRISTYNYWVHHCGADYLFVQPQIGPFRVDFAIGRIVVNEAEKLGRLPVIIVECDGHDFHEKTKEQADKDKSRDVELQTMGYRVIRFTGSRITRDAKGCVESVYRLFEQLESELFPSEDMMEKELAKFVCEAADRENAGRAAAGKE